MSRGSQVNLYIKDEDPPSPVSITKFVLVGCVAVCVLGLVSWGAVEIATSNQADDPGHDEPTPTPPPGPPPTPLLPDCEGICYRIGRGMTDITGLPVEGALFGYADPGLDARGIHLRIFSRAFIFQHKTSGKTVVFVATELTIISAAVHKAVMDRLEEIFPDGKYGYKNVMLSPNHSHAAPGGYNTYFMYAFPDLGFVEQTFNVTVEGIVQSIVKADDDLHDSRLFTNTGEVPEGGNVNRALWAFEQNPQEEQDRFPHNIDRDLTILKMTNDQDDPKGLLGFFGVHTVSMPNTQHLVSSDNMGWASQALERWQDPINKPGETDFIAAIAPGLEGDASPRAAGQWCDFDQQIECDHQRSTCAEDPTDPRLCNGYGLGYDDYSDTRKNGELQAQTAKELFETAEHELLGGIDYVFKFVNMSGIVVGEEGGEVKKTCRPSMGYSFAAGATDGPGIPPFTQGELEGLPVLDQAIDLIFGLPEDLVECQKPKPILLPTGTTDFPRPWQPEILPLQIFRIGDIVLIGIPHEVCTMAGTRIKDAVKKTMIEDGYPDTIQPVVAAMTNTFASYLTTYEEYQVQRYEGASTIFGQHQLEAYILKYTELARSMARGLDLDLGPLPPDMYSDSWRDALPPHRQDDDLGEYDIGDVLQDVEPQYQQGESVVVRFLSGSPRNDYKEKIGDTYLTVERQVGQDWVVEYTDAHFETRFYWDSTCQHKLISDPALGNILSCGLNIQLDLDIELPIPIPPIGPNPSQQSNITVVWDIPENQAPGIYRIKQHGTSMNFAGIINPQPQFTPYTGTSSEFEVVENTGGATRRYIHPTSPSTQQELPDDLFEALLGPLWKKLGKRGPSLEEIRKYKADLLAKKKQK